MVWPGSTGMGRTAKVADPRTERATFALSSAGVNTTTMHVPSGDCSL